MWCRVVRVRALGDESKLTKIVNAEYLLYALVCSNSSKIEGSSLCNPRIATACALSRSAVSSFSRQSACVLGELQVRR